jgi:Rps23 Pro-64 3,4-dihydroxylase Tpa1-like proline 4-hydroxylase
MIELLNPIDVQKLKHEIASRPPFPHFCIDNFLNEDFANDVHDSFPAFADAQALGREFKAVNEKRKVQITDPTKFPPAIKKLHDLLASNEFLELMSELLGVPNLLADPQLVGGGIHETNTGGHLDVHVDFNLLKDRGLHRRINILIYFNHDWKEEYGGYLDIWDAEVKKRYGYFAPKFNRACGFVTSDISFHGVTPLSCPPDQMRRSFAAYFYTKEAPPGWDGKFHSTIFKARPDEFLKGKVLMPMELLKKNIRTWYRKTKNKAKNVMQK